MNCRCNSSIDRSIDWSIYNISMLANKKLTNRFFFLLLYLILIIIVIHCFSIYLFFCLLSRFFPVCLFFKYIRVKKWPLFIDFFFIFVAIYCTHTHTPISNLFFFSLLYDCGSFVWVRIHSKVSMCVFSLI